VKEADALAGAGHEVHAIGTDCGLWPSKMDNALMSRRSWTFAYAGGTLASRSARFRWMRVRHAVSRRLFQRMPGSSFLRRRALARGQMEIERAALAFRADLYIAHHASVLPAAVAAAQLSRGYVGYDAEDFYSGMWTPENGPGVMDTAIERIEEQYLRDCDYITASSREIADAYVSRFGVARPVTVLNVFPLANRPAVFRPTAISGPLRLYWFSQCIGSHRGLEDVVRAMGLLRTRDIELHLQGDWQVGYQKQFLQLAAQSGVDAGRIHAHEPILPDEIVRTSAEYDIGLALELPSIQNRGMCLTNKVFTYLLAGNALIATATPAQQGLLSGCGRAAVMYQPRDTENMAAHLRRWYDDRQELARARQCAWNLGQQRYHWEFEQRFFLDAVQACGARAATATAIGKQ
jgi:glycosyltransferase involved in cell wall biosynthesis